MHPTTQALPIVGKPFSLRCAGFWSPASITWLKNKRQMLISKRVVLSSDNATLTFSRLLKGDRGVYQCLVQEGRNRSFHYDTLAVVEGGTPILSVGYLMQVNCEYTRVMKITSLCIRAVVSNIELYLGRRNLPIC